MKSDQDLYKRLRELPKEELWNSEVARFNAAAPRERMEGVAVIRAVGMIFSRFGTEEEKSAVREWLITLLHDRQEKIRRYAMAALPKVGAGEGGEEQMLTLLKQTDKEREKHHLGRALEKVGGVATLALVDQGGVLPGFTEQKVKAAVARHDNPGTVRMDVLLPADENSGVFLRCRRGLEDFVRDEAEELLIPGGIFQLGGVRPGCVTLIPRKPFSLAMIYRLRCFATLGFSRGTVKDGSVESLARRIASPETRDLMLAATEGAARYRLEFAGHGHQRGAIRQVVDRAYALSPEILNDSRQAPWSIDVIPLEKGESSVELRPRLHPDPRLFYRRDDIAAASHPPLASCMARLAGITENDSIWDPFCGSGLELIERALRGGATAVYGTDLDPKAIEVSEANFAAARLAPTRVRFTCCDFRDAGQSAGIASGSISLIITNPPLGRRVRVKDMQGLFADLYAEASRVLREGGRLVFVNPLRTGPSDPSLKQEYQKTIDLGGFNCRLEMYRKHSRGLQMKPSRQRQVGAPHEAPAPGKKTAPAWWSRVGRSRHS